MRAVRAAGRAALAWVFLRAGVDVVANPSRPAATAGPFLERLRAALPVPLPGDATVVRANAAAQIAGAALFATGRAPRLAAGGLIASLVPTTLAGHAFWKVDDPALRPNQRNHFNKNLAVVGGLLLFIAERRPRPAAGTGRRA